MLERLRDNLLRRGVGVTGDGLAATLALNVAKTAPAPAVKTTVDFVLHGAGAHAGSAIPLAKGASKMMAQNKLKLVAIKCVLAAACVGAGAAVVTQATRSATPATQPSVILADSIPASQTANPPGIEAQYQACRQVFQLTIDAYDAGDAAAAKSQLYFGPDAGSRMVTIVPVLVDVDFAVYRLQKAAVARFGAHAIGMNAYWSPTVIMLVAVMPRIDAKECRSLGDTIVLTPAAPSYSHSGAWPRAPFYFHNAQGVWKLDVGRTFKISYNARRRQPIPGETREQAFCAGEKIFVDGFNAISDDIEHGRIDDAGTVQKRIDDVMVDLTKQFSDIGVQSGPR